jgi:hypothetical protein
MDNYSNSDNLNHRVKPFRVILKALILFIVFYVLLTSFPDITYPLFRRFMPKLDKFPFYVVYPKASAQHEFTLQNVFNINNLLYSHVISWEGKPANQYRIIFIGDSTVYFSKIYPMITGIECDGKILRAYNLGYPGVSATKDLMILQEAMKYSPDLIVWSVTFSYADNNEEFLRANPDRFTQLVNTYQLSRAGYNSSQKGKTIFYQSDGVRNETYLILYYLILDPATGGQNSIFQTALNDAITQVVVPVHGDQLLSILQAFKEMTKGTPVLLINEPRPSVIVNLTQYSQFRKDILYQSSKERIDFLDLWNLVPNQGFVDHVHRNDEGEILFEKAVIPAITAIACGQK